MSDKEKKKREYEWWEMLDWNKMPHVFKQLPEELKKKIREKSGHALLILVLFGSALTYYLICPKLFYAGGVVLVERRLIIRFDKPFNMTIELFDEHGFLEKIEITKGLGVTEYSYPIMERYYPIYNPVELSGIIEVPYILHIWNGTLTNVTFYPVNSTHAETPVICLAGDEPFYG